MINSRDINELHPALKRAAIELKSRLAAQGYDMLITCTYRDGEYQNSLYEQGRTKAGQVVTNAKAGQSMHNYRLAFDICKNIKGQEYSDAGFFNTAGRIGEEMGLCWGGNFKSLVDKPHFEFTNGLGIKELAAGQTVPLDCKLAWEMIEEREECRCLPEKITVLVNGRKAEAWRVLYNDFNYIRIRDLETLDLGITVGYDDALKIPVLNSVNSI